MRSAELQEALGSEDLLNYCQNKSLKTSLPSEKMLWQFLKVGSSKPGCSEMFP
jgi:protein transport protein SEC31